MRSAKVKQGSGNTVTWSELDTGVAADVMSLAGREGVLDKVFQGVRVFEIIVRWRDDIRADDQVRYDTLDLNVRSIEDRDGRRRWLHILADTESALATSA